MHTTAHPDDEHGGVHHAAQPAGRRAGGADDAQSRRVGRQRDRAAALRRARADSHRGARASPTATTASTSSTSPRWSTTASRSGSKRRSRSGARETVLRDVVRIIRMERPLVLLSRFQGNERDGHGNHQTAGLVTLQAFQAGRRSERVSRADQGGPAAVAALQGLHRRRARERGLDRAHRQRRVQSVARRLVTTTSRATA